MKEVDLKGIIPACVLPMTEDYRIDEEALRHYISWLIPQGVKALAINVDTGEGPHLFPEERRRVIEVVREEVRGRVPIIAGLAAGFTAQAVTLAKEAEAAGADALLVFPIPAFQGRELSPEVPYHYHRAIADAVDIPLILFQLQPALGGLTFSPEAIARLVEIENVVAMKEASFDAKTFVETRELLDSLPRRITLLTGNDNFILESFILGAEGALIGFGTVATDLQVEMFDSVMGHDYNRAWEIWRRLLPLEKAIFAPPIRNYRARLKAALMMQGIIKNYTVRPPLPPLAPEEVERVKVPLWELGLIH